MFTALMETYSAVIVPARYRMQGKTIILAFIELINFHICLKLLTVYTWNVTIGITQERPVKLIKPKGGLNNSPFLWL